MLIGRLSQMSPPPCLYDTVIQSYVQLKSGFYSFHGPSYTIESQWGNFGTLLPPRGATFTPFWGMVLQSLPASSSVVIHKFLRNSRSELRPAKFCPMHCQWDFWGDYLPLGRTSYPRSLIKVIAHHSRLGRTFWHLIHGSVTKTAGGVARRKKSGRRRIISMSNNNNVLCHIWQAPLTRMYISRRKMWNGAAVAKTRHWTILVTSRFASIFFSMISILLPCCEHD